MTSRPSVSESSWWTGWPAFQPEVQGGTVPVISERKGLTDARLQIHRGRVRLFRASHPRSAASRDVSHASHGTSWDVSQKKKYKKQKQMTQGCFRTWPSCNSLRSFGIYWSIWENKSCTPCRQKERQNTWRSCCCGCPSQQQCLAYFPPDNQGRRPPGATPDLGSRDTDAGQKPMLKLEGMLHLAHRALGLDYSAASWSPFLCFSILPQVCFIRTILCWVFSFSNCTKIHKTFLQSSWKAVPKNC